MILNAICVFNSFPLIWVVTGDQPGHRTDTTITFAYKIAFREQLYTGEAAALSVLNVLVLLPAVVLVYLRTVPWRAGDDESVPRPPGRPRARVAGARVAAGEWTGGVLAPVRRAARAVLGPAGRAVARGWRVVRPVGLPLAGLAIAVFFLAPYAVMFLASVKTDGDLFATPAGYLPSSWQWSNWLDVWDTLPLAAARRALPDPVPVPLRRLPARDRAGGGALRRHRADLVGGLTAGSVGEHGARRCLTAPRGDRRAAQRRSQLEGNHRGRHGDLDRHTRGRGLGQP